MGIRSCVDTPFTDLEPRMLAYMASCIAAGLQLRECWACARAHVYFLSRLTLTQPSILAVYCQ